MKGQNVESSSFLVQSKRKQVLRFDRKIEDRKNGALKRDLKELFHYKSV